MGFPFLSLKRQCTKSVTGEVALRSKWAEWHEDRESLEWLLPRRGYSLSGLCSFDIPNRESGEIFLRPEGPWSLDISAFYCGGGAGVSRRDAAIVAWHEVPGTASPQKSRPVGYGLIRAGVRTDSTIGATKFQLY